MQCCRLHLQKTTRYLFSIGGQQEFTVENGILLVKTGEFEVSYPTLTKLFILSKQWTEVWWIRTMNLVDTISLSSKNLIEEFPTNNKFRDSNIGLHDSPSSSNTENAAEVITVSLDDYDSSYRKNTEVHSKVGNITHHTLLFSCLGLSLILIIISATILNVTDVKTFSLTAHKILKLLRFIGLYSFSGGLSVTLAIKYFLRLKIPCFKRYISNRREIVKYLVKQFLLSEIFEDRFVKQYMKRADCVQKVDSMQSSALLLESTILKELVANKYQAIKDSPEGLLLESLGIQQKDMQQYFQTFITGFLVEYHKVTSIDGNDKKNFDSNLFRRLIENMTVEKMDYVNANCINHIIKETLHIHLDLIVSLVTIIMGLFGLIVGLVVIFM